MSFYNRAKANGLASIGRYEDFEEENSNEK